MSCQEAVLLATRPGPEDMQPSNYSSASPSHSWYPGPQSLFLEILMITMCLGALTGNALVMFIIAATKRFHTVTSAFIINLAICDFLVGLVTMPIVAMSVLYDGWTRFNEVCLFVGYMASVYSSASVLGLAAIALDRYWTLVDCLQYQTPRTTQRTLATIIWVWLQALLCNVPPLFGWGHISYVPEKYTCITDWSQSISYAVFFSVFSVFLPISIIIYCHLKINSIARGHAKRIHDLENQLRRNSIRSNASEVEKPTCSRVIYFINCKLLAEAYYWDTQSISSYIQDIQSSASPNQELSEHESQEKAPHGRLHLLLVIIAVACCWIPYVIVNLFQAIENVSSMKISSVPSAVNTTAYWLTLCNSDMNPFLYALLSRRFQKALHTLCNKLRASGGLSSQQEHPPFQRRRTSSNVTGISMFISPADQPDPEDNTPGDHSSISSENSEHSDDSVPGGCHDSPSSNSPSYTKRRAADPVTDGVILKPSDLSEQFLQVPSSSPWRKQHSSSQETVTKKSTLVCGNITITIDCDGD